ncbi:MAG: Tol-Pal system beta propeller repeat protein TolB [Gammaproteobacteria bacterium]
MVKGLLKLTPLLAALLWGTAQAALTIEITQGVQGALPIAVVPFSWEGVDARPPLDVGGVIAADLYRSGRFSPLPVADMLSRPHEGSRINFADWRLLGVDNIVVGRLRALETGFEVRFQLFDVFRGSQLTGYSIRTTAKRLRFTAHQISDIIYETLLGEPGAFATRIAYVTEVKQADGSRRYSLQVADADGYNPRPILSSRQPLMSPSWSPDGKRLAYVSFETGQPTIYIQDVGTGKRHLISYYPGLNGAPAWSPDGSRLAMVLSKSGSPDIWILDLDSGRLTRITRSFAIDTEPVWSPDGSAIVFTSDRGGKPQLYRITLRSGKVERLTFEGGYNARAAWSPDGKHLAMVHGEKGQYHIAVLELASGALRVLTDTPLDESPSFAPNGSMIIYATEVGRKGVLSAVSVDGRVHQRLKLEEGDAREPAWSPYLQ